MLAVREAMGCLPEPIYHRSIGMTTKSGFANSNNSFSFRNPSLHPDRLHIRKFANPVSAQFPAISGPFHPAKGDPRIGGHHLIDKNHARFELIDEEFLLTFIVRPRARAQAKPAVVGDPNRFLSIFHAENGGHWAKKFFAVGGRIGWNIRQNRRLIKTALAFHRLAACEKFRTGLDRFADVGME